MSGRTQETAGAAKLREEPHPSGRGAGRAAGGEGPAPVPERRRILNLLLGGSALATVGSVLYPIFRFMVPPKSAGDTPRMVLAGKVKDFPTNSGKLFRFGEKPGILIRTKTGEWRAFSATCTHLSCTVQYRADAQQIWCACHNGFFDLTGRNVAGPPPRPLPSFQVTVRGDDVFVIRESEA